ncbi:MAG: ribosome maturation factor RimP [Leptospirillia bacterium]
MEAPLIERIREILLPILASRSLEVFDIERNGGILRVTLDRLDGAVDIGDCTEVSNFLSHALDVEDLIPGNYRLEVSSPGLDRPLRNLDDFRRFAGQLCRIRLAEPENGDYVIFGHIREVGDDRVTLETLEGHTRVIPYANVERARLEVEF